MKANLLKVWIAVTIVSYVIEAGWGYWMGPMLKNQVTMPWRVPDAQMFVTFFGISVIASLAFAYFFLQGYQGKGMMEGLRFGLWITLLASIPYNAGYAAMLPMGRRVPLLFVCGDLITFIVCGAVAAAIAGQKAGVSAAAA